MIIKLSHLACPVAGASNKAVHRMAKRQNASRRPSQTLAKPRQAC